MNALKLSVAILVLAVPVPALAQSAPAAAQPWWERLTFGGDFRGRYEGFFQEERETRHRERVRLRLSLGAEVTPEVTLGLRVATGHAEDLASTNQSLGELLARKPLHLDRAFITYVPDALPALTLGGGKYGYPVTRTELVWDDDVNWEGTYQEIEGAFGPATLRFVAAQSPIDEVDGGPDAFLIAWFGEAEWEAAGHAAALSAANYRFLREDRIAVAVDRLGLSNSNTNIVTRDVTGAVTGFASEFNLVDVIGRATIATGLDAYPLTLLADAVWNTAAATDDDRGVWLAAELGEAADPGTMLVTYTFARIERDAVLRTFNFSDIPGTNVRMHAVGLSYMPVRRVNVDLTTIFTKPLETIAGPARHLLTRVQFDMRVTF